MTHYIFFVNQKTEYQLKICYCTRSAFTKNIMVSDSISKLGCTGLVLWNHEQKWMGHTIVMLLSGVEQSAATDQGRFLNTDIPTRD